MQEYDEYYYCGLILFTYMKYLRFALNVMAIPLIPVFDNYKYIIFAVCDYKVI